MDDSSIPADRSLPSDREHLVQALIAASEVLPSKLTFTPDAAHLYVRALEDLDLRQVMRAIGWHVQNSKWMPTPADIRERVAEASAPPSNSKDLGELPYDEYLRTRWWKDLRAAVHERDNGRCQLCGASDMPMDVHHRTYEHRGSPREVNDCILLCRQCHAVVHGIERPPTDVAD